MIGMIFQLIILFYMKRNYPEISVQVYFGLASLGLAFAMNNNLEMINLSLLLVIALIDFKLHIIPNELNITFLIVNICFLFLGAGPKIRLSIHDVFIVSFILLSLLFSVFSNKIGIGDIKLFIVLYLSKGSKNFIIMLMFLSIILFIFSIIKLFFRRGEFRGYAMGPFILFAYLLHIV